jgi:hypothetical protein
MAFAFLFKPSPSLPSLEPPPVKPEQQVVLLTPTPYAPSSSPLNRLRDLSCMSKGAATHTGLLRHFHRDKHDCQPAEGAHDEQV